MSDQANEPEDAGFFENAGVPDDLSSLEDTPPAVADLSASDSGADGVEPLNVEDLVVTLEATAAERDQYLDSLRRVQAEFENYKKAVAKRSVDERDRANDKIVTELLPVLDACEGAVKNGSEDVVPVQNQLLLALERHGLEKSEPADQPFDPEQHEAVMHEPSDEVDVPTVAEVLRTGYLWKGRTLRPAMVRVKG